ncbi:MAG: hypothetical protein C0596_13250 [Marinilabiliales bacterium]|nr:MAG: hypothetical protein C0596_13250 [Marinilabiliales bacterium]
MFTIDDDAYQMLKLYLGKLEEHFSAQEEGNEIVKDIEARIAEIFSMKINEGKQVINITDVEELITILGNVEDITGENMSDKTNDSDNNEQKKETKRKKKLYRDPDNKQVGGICSGLSYYTGISATTWRILFLIFLFVGQVSIIAYLILWIAVPEAKTTSEKLEMKGDKVNLSNIEKSVKKEYDDLKKNFKNIKTKKTTDTLNNIGKAILSLISITAKVLGKVLGVAFLITGTSILVALTIGLLSVSKENVFFANDFINMIWLPGLLENITNTGTSWLLSISLLVVFVIPVIVVIYWGILLLFNVKSNKYLGIGTFTLWVLAIIVATITSLNVAASFSSVEQNTITETIQCDSISNYYFELNPEAEELKLLNEDDINNINYFHIFIDQHLIVNDGNEIKHLPEIEFYTTKDSCPELEFIYYARGANKKEAGENIKSIKYNYEINDSIIYFDPYFYITSEKYRAQFVKVKVFIPEDHTFIID